MNKLIEVFQRPRLGLRWKLLGGFLATNLLLITALAMSLSSLFGNSDALREVRDSSSRSQILNDIEQAQSQLVISAIDYAWSNNLSRLNDFDIAKRNLERSLKSFQPESTQQENYNLLLTEQTSLLATLDRLAILTDNNLETQAKMLWRQQASKEATRVGGIVRDLKQQEQQLAVIEYEKAQLNAKNTAWLISGIGTLAVLLAVLLAYLLTAAVTRPVGQLRQHLSQLAGGDLSQSVSILNRDELGDLGGTYNSALQALRDLVKQLYTQSQQVSIATSELTHQAQNQVAGSSQQASAITEATHSLHELNRTAQAIARQALSVNEAVEQSLLQARAVSRAAEEMELAQEQGRATVARAVESLYNLKDQVASIEEHQQELVAQSTSIKSIIKLIDNIAKETHLLALNAAIEAAGAGSYGTRFAVIAEEVKRLADASVVATKGVRDSLIGIADAVARASESAVRGLQEAEQVVEEAGQADTSLVVLAALSRQVKSSAQEIVNNIEGTAVLANNIGEATQQQQAASHQMLETMVSIETVTSQTLNNVRQGENATQKLNLTARELEQSADAFKLAVA